MKQIENSEDFVYAQFMSSGTYAVSLLASLGQCRDEITKYITINTDSTDADEGRLGGDPFVKEFHLYPVPNEGNFKVKVQLREESAIILSVSNILSGKQIYRITDSGQTTYEKDFNLAPLTAGPYTLRLDHQKGTKFIRFIVH
jgi:hypothetical protein